MSASFPAGSGRDAARRWLRDRTPAGGSTPLPTHAEMLRRQRDRLLSRAGFAPGHGAANAAKLDLVLEGPTVIDHGASISMLGSVLTSLQGAVTAVAQALEGTPTAVGQVAGYITAATQLRSIAAFPSSYGLHLQGPDMSIPGWEQGMLPLPPDMARTPPESSAYRLLPEAVGALLDITDLARNEEENGVNEQLLERLVPLGQRALGHLVNLSGTLVSNEASLKLTWQPDTVQARTASLGASAAARLKYLSEGVQFGEAAERRLEGELIEASLRRGSIVIELDSGTLVSARTESTVTARLRDDLLGKRVVAEARLIVAKYAGGRQREIYVVTDIALSES